MSGAGGEQPKQKMSDKMKNAFKGFGRKKEQAPAKTGDDIPESNFDIDELENRPLDKLASADALFEEIREFLWQAKETIDFAQKSKNSSMGAKIGLPPMGVTASVNKWRAKRKGNTLFSKFDKINARIEQVEKDMKFITDESLQDNSTLMMQALHVKWRLKACIKFNEQAVLDTLVSQKNAKELLQTLTKAHKSLMAMICFLDEVGNLKDRETQIGISRAEEYIPWALRQSKSEEEENNAPLVSPIMVKRENFQKRLDRVKKMKTIAENNTALIQKQLTVQQVNLKHCSNCMLAMNKMLRSINTPSIVQQITTTDFSAANDFEHGDDASDGVIVHTNPIVAASRDQTRYNAESTANASEDAAVLTALDDAATVVTEEVTTGTGTGTTRSKSEGADTMEEDAERALHEAAEEKARVAAKEAVEAAAAAALEPGNSGWDDDEEESDEENEQGVKIVKRPLSEFMPPGAMKEQLIAEEETDYDHRNCQDCALVFSMGNDCLMHLAASQHIAQESAKRLMKLYELREKVKDNAATLESQDWGEGGGKGGVVVGGGAGGGGAASPDASRKRGASFN